MSYYETIDNYLYDEENEYTQANDLWEDFFIEKKAEIDERPWIQADALVHRKDLNRQVGDMIDRVLPEEERICCAFISELVVVAIPWMNSSHSLTASAK